MSVRMLLPLVLLITSACHKPSVDAPKELGELGAFLHKHYDDEDTAELQAGLLSLQDFLLGVDLSLDYKDNAVTMPILKGANLGTLVPPTGVDASEQVNVALPGRSSHTLDEALVSILEPNQICIESSSTVWSQRTFNTDTACFEDHSCEYLEVTNEVRKQNVLAKVWFDQHKSYRWVMVADEEGNETEMLIARSWIDKQFPADGGGGNSWDQLYQIDVSIPDPDNNDETLRWFSIWSSITLAGLTDDAYSNLVRDGLQEGYIYGDEFIENNITECKNDRDAEKPERG
ncbi:MAG: hypothetical protein GWP91_14665 [Rhodobacterales bacterium]|nr:hypothetical protein [Rhodobacterales bacterium]